MTGQIHQEALSALRERMRLHVSSVEIRGDKVAMSGWLTPALSLEALELVGAELISVSYPMPRRRIATIFGLSEYEQSGFEMIARPHPDETMGPRQIIVRPMHGVACQDSLLANTWIIPLDEYVVPEAGKITRVTGRGTSSAYVFGGATHAYRLATALELLTSRALGQFSSIVDWGCGAGRLLQHLSKSCPGRVFGVDVDSTNLEWCKKHLPDIPIQQIPWDPPTTLADESVDALIAFSVFSHIGIRRIHNWLRELRRIVSPGGVCVVTTIGVVSAAFRSSSAAFFERLQQMGYVEWRNQGQLDDVRPSEESYLNIAFSRSFAHQLFSEYFLVRGVVEGLGPQDAWILQRH